MLFKENSVIVSKKRFFGNVVETGFLLDEADLADTHSHHGVLLIVTNGHLVCGSTL